MIKINITVGTTITEAVDQAIHIAERIDRPVHFNFNDIRLKVTKDSIVKDIVEQYYQTNTTPSFLKKIWRIFRCKTI